MPETTQPGLPSCLAPPLTDSLLARYELLAGGAGGPVGDSMLELLAAVKKWWDLPESSRTDGLRFVLLHRSDPTQERKPIDMQMVPLEDDHQRSLFDLIPWGHELQAMQSLFETINPDSHAELRNAANHLLWFVLELFNDREPLTMDKIP